MVELKVGHYYKRVYYGGVSIVFRILNIDNASLFIDVIKSKKIKNEKEYNYICSNFPESKTVELDKAEALAYAL